MILDDRSLPDDCGLCFILLLVDFLQPNLTSPDLPPWYYSKVLYDFISWSKLVGHTGNAWIPMCRGIFVSKKHVSVFDASAPYAMPRHCCCWGILNVASRDSGIFAYMGFAVVKTESQYVVPTLSNLVWRQSFQYGSTVKMRRLAHGADDCAIQSSSWPMIGMRP